MSGLAPPRVVSDASVAEVAHLLTQAPLVAIDTEFHTEGRYLPELFLVQLHVPEVGTWIVDPLAGDHLARLAPALLGGCTWLVHAGQQDLRLLTQALGGVADVVLDTQVAAGLISPVYPDALDRLVARWLEEPLPKAAQLSDWSKRPLTAAQTTYAARDVLCLPGLWDAILSDARGLGREQLVLDACATVRDEALTPNPHAWRRIVRNSSAQPRAAAILRELMAWREGEAQRTNRPAAFILGDAMLRQITKGAPSSLGDLAANRRMKPRLVERHGPALLAAVHRGQQIPEADLPWTAPRGSAAADRVAWITLLASTLGRARSFAPRLALPEHLIEQVAALGAPTRADVAGILGSWRDTLLGEELFSGLQGQLSLTLKDDHVFADRSTQERGKSEGS